MPRQRSTQLHDVYRRRLLLSLVGALLLVIVLVRGWPGPSPSSSDRPFSSRPSERIQVKEIQPTRQALEQNPPPPAPLPPVVVPNNEVIETPVTFGDAALRVETPEDDPTRQDGNNTRRTASRRPDTGARLLRNVQPQYPSAAQDDDVRARIRVGVTVSKTGRVEEAVVLERWRLSENGSAQPVGSLGYGLEEAALAAARRSLFRPARHEGQPVATRTTITFTFGN